MMCELKARAQRMFRRSLAPELEELQMDLDPDFPRAALSRPNVRRFALVACLWLIGCLPAESLDDPETRDGSQIGPETGVADRDQRDAHVTVDAAADGGQHDSDPDGDSVVG